MSGGSTRTNQHSESNFVQNDYNLGKIFIRNNRYAVRTFANNTAGTAAFSAGTIVALNTSTGNLVPWDNDVITNDQDKPVGILRDDVPSLAAAGTQANVYYCIFGDVASERIVFNDNTQSLGTLIASLGKQVRDELRRLGIIPIATTEITTADNS